MSSHSFPKRYRDSLLGARSSPSRPPYERVRATHSLWHRYWRSLLGFRLREPTTGDSRLPGNGLAVSDSVGPVSSAKSTEVSSVRAYSLDQFRIRELKPLALMLNKSTDLPLSEATVLIQLAMIEAAERWEERVVSDNPQEWVLGYALRLHQNQQRSSSVSSFPREVTPSNVEELAASSTSETASNADARLTGALAVAAVPARPITVTTETLLTEAKLGSASADWDADRAITAIYTSHYRSLVRLALVLVRDEAAAEDVVQDSFIAAYGSWRRLRDPDKMLSYLRQSVVNRSRSALRHRIVVDKNAPKPAPDITSAEQRAISLAEERSAVISALRTLPPRQREAVVLKYYADLSDAQIANVMGISPGAVKSHMARGRAALRTVLGVGT